LSQILIYSDQGVNKYLKDDKLSDMVKIKNIKKMSKKYSDCTLATVFLELTNQKDNTFKNKEELLDIFKKLSLDESK